ncbi:NADPH-dependent FMN reductase [Metabacillus indicus]|uniref:NADPH-dependent FMN reductase n=1 Tax=Metabacillus indicus TaxID=246786 RepID=UPI002A058B4A|nr:NADPH-dependent FMN reductase [Metabacillus indicus]MDX8290383.1 NADPH-dependent FMN reductase [Metabacillus indicus]
MGYIVSISGSPSAESRSSVLSSFLRKEAEQKGTEVKEFSVLDFDPAVLIHGKYDDPSIVHIGEVLRGASGVIIVSPVYKAAYTGALKALLDLLPQDAFKDKPVFPLMVGGSFAHLLAIDYSLKPLLAALSAQTILKGVYVLDKFVDKADLNNPVKDEEVQSKIEVQLGQFLEISLEMSSEAELG